MVLNKSYLIGRNKESFIENKNGLIRGVFLHEIHYKLINKRKIMFIWSSTISSVKNNI
jgi:hypothetical protein